MGGKMENINYLKKLLDIYDINNDVTKIKLIKNICMRHSNIVEILAELKIEYKISKEVGHIGLIITSEDVYFKYDDKVVDINNNSVLKDIKTLEEYIFLSLKDINDCNYKTLNYKTYRNNKFKILFRYKFLIFSYLFLEIIKTIMLFFDCIFIRTMLDVYTSVINYTVIAMGSFFIIFFSLSIILINECAKNIVFKLNNVYDFKNNIDSGNLKNILDFISLPIKVVVVFYLSSYINFEFLKIMILVFVISTMISLIINEYINRKYISIFQISYRTHIIFNIFLKIIITLNSFIIVYSSLCLYVSKKVSLGALAVMIIYSLYIHIIFLNGLDNILSYQIFDVLLENIIFNKLINQTKKNKKLYYNDDGNLYLRNIILNYNDVFGDIQLNSNQNALFVENNMLKRKRLLRILTGKDAFNNYNIFINGINLSELFMKHKKSEVSIISRTSISKNVNIENCLKSDIYYLLEYLNIPECIGFKGKFDYYNKSYNYKILIHVMDSILNNSKIIILMEIIDFLKEEQLKNILTLCKENNILVICIENTVKFPMAWENILNLSGKVEEL